MKMLDSAGATTGSVNQTWIMSAGSVTISGINGNATTTSTLRTNGGVLTVDGGSNLTIGTTGRGDVIGGGGFVKNGAGTLTLGGTVANSYAGGTVVNAGSVIAGKVSALGGATSVVNVA